MEIAALLGGLPQLSFSGCRRDESYWVAVKGRMVQINIISYKSF
jgi:hypothetical protein